MPGQPMSSQEFIKALLSPERQQRLDPNSLLVQLPIDPYHAVADIGCGPGYFSLPIAKYLSYGKLYALDIEDEMLDALRDRAKAARLSNIEILKSGKAGFPLPESSLDGVLLAFVVHQNEDRLTFLKGATQLLKPRGWCGVLEWYRKETEMGPPLEKRIEPEEMADLGREAGLNLLRQRDLNGEQYLLLFRR